MNIYNNNDFKITKLFHLIKCFLNNEDKNILKHFFFADNKFNDEYINYHLSINFYFNNNNFDYINGNMKKFFALYIPELENKTTSFVFEYIKNKIDWIIEEEKEEEIEEKLAKYLGEFNDICLFISSIGKEQNKNIYNSIIDLILSFDNDYTIFMFLKKDIEINSEKNFAHTIKIIQQISNDTIERTNKFSKKEILSYIGGKIIDKTTVINLYKFILVLRKEKNTLFNLVKKNNFFVINSFYILYMNYLYCFHNKHKKHSKHFSKNDEILQIIFSELSNFVSSYNKESNLKNNDIFNIGDILLNLNDDKIICDLKKLINFEIKFSNQKLINNLNNISFPILINIFEKEILVFIWYIFNMREEKFINIDDNDKENIILNFNNFNIDIITFFFDEFLSSINPDLKTKYESFKNFFIDFISYKHYYNNENNENNKNDKDVENSIDIIKNNNSQDFYFFLMIIYIKNKFPNYNPILLIYIYNNYCSNFEEKKNFFLLFIKCIREKERNEHISINLFLLKNEDVAYFNIKTSQKEFFHLYVYKFISNYLLDMKNSKYSFFNFYFSKILNEYDRIKNEDKEENQNKEENEEIEPPRRKRKSKELECIKNIISYAGFYYSSNMDKNIYKILLDKFISFDVSFYDFLRVNYTLNNEDKFRKIIKNIEDLSKNTEEKSLNANINNFDFNIWRNHYYYLNKFKNFDYYYDYHSNYYEEEHKFRNYGEININSFINLYMLLKTLKIEKISLIKIIKSNYVFLLYFISLFRNIFYIYYYISKHNVFFVHYENQKNMLMFVLNEIYSFYTSFLNSKIDNKINAKIEEKYYSIFCDYKIFFYLNKIFNNKIIKLNKKDIIKEYEIFKKIFFLISQKKKKYTWIILMKIILKNFHIIQ